MFSIFFGEKRTPKKNSHWVTKVSTMKNGRLSFPSKEIHRKSIPSPKKVITFGKEVNVIP